jgi:hypothetical protein
LASAVAAECGAGQRGLFEESRRAEPVRHRIRSNVCASSRRLVRALASSLPQPGGLPGRATIRRWHRGRLHSMAKGQPRQIPGRRPGSMTPGRPERDKDRT